MITLTRANERRRARHDGHDTWVTSCARGSTNPETDDFGMLEALSEDHLSPGASIRRQLHRDAELVTYVLAGALATRGLDCSSSLLSAGGFQYISAGRGIRHSETNASRSAPAHLFHLAIRPSPAEPKPSRDQKWFSAAERRGRLCTVASRDGRRGSLRIHQDATVYSAILESGTHIVHELLERRRAWLHVVTGELSLGNLLLTTGDGAGVTAEHAISFTACEETEVLLVDLGDSSPPWPLPTRAPAGSGMGWLDSVGASQGREAQAGGTRDFGGLRSDRMGGSVLTGIR